MNDKDRSSCLRTIYPKVSVFSRFSNKLSLVIIIIIILIIIIVIIIIILIEIIITSTRPTAVVVVVGYRVPRWGTHGLAIEPVGVCGGGGL